MASGKAIWKQRDLLLTRFPFSDLQHAKVRPVLVLSNDRYNRQAPGLVVCAVTSSTRQHPYAVEVDDRPLESGQLHTTSRIRLDAIAAIEQRIVLKRIGRLRSSAYQGVVELLGELVRPPMGSIRSLPSRNRSAPAT